MKEQFTIIRHLIENNHAIGIFNENMFEGGGPYELFRIVTEINKRGRSVTLSALKYFLETHRDKMIPAYNELLQTESIDWSTCQLMADSLRISALKRTSIKLASVDPSDPKDEKLYNKLFKDLTDLDQGWEQPETLDYVDFHDYTSHRRVEGRVISTGLQFLIGTGSDLEIGQVMTVVAPSGNGKSQALCHFAKHLLSTGKNVLVLLGEESETDFHIRVARGFLNMTDYQYSSLLDAEISMYNENMRKSIGHMITKSITKLYVEDLEQYILDVEDKVGYQFDAIIIDYAKLLEVKESKKNEENWKSIEKIFKELKRIAMNDSRRCVITAVQSNREAYGKGKSVRNENVSESMGAVHNSDLMISLKLQARASDEVIRFEDDFADRTNSIIRMQINKRRKGTAVVESSHLFSLKSSGNLIYIPSDNNTVSFFDTDNIWDLLDDPHV